MIPPGLVRLLPLAAMVGCAAQTPDTGLSAQLETEARAIVDAYDLPGLTVAVVNDAATLAVAAGVANRENGELMTPSTRMLAASIGKTFVAAIVLQLAEDGVLTLDDPISRWLGDREWFHRLPNAETITVRQLLQHSSGLRDHVHMPAFAALWPEQGANVTPEDLIALVLDEAPLFPPGEGWSYTDTGYLLVGLVLESASGERYEDLLRRHVLAPLKLVATGPSNRQALPGLARGYVSSNSGLRLPAVTTDERGRMLWDPAVEWTGGGLFSTSGDLAAWGRAFLSGRHVEPVAYRQMLDSVATSEHDPTSRYGLGVAIRTQSAWGKVYGHRGWIPGYVSSLQYYPDYDTAIAFQTNTDIGIVDADRPVVLAIEERLAALVLGKPGDKQERPAP